MTVHKLSNPKKFIQEAHQEGVRYEYLIEAIECIGKQKLSQMFSGKSSRGKANTLSSASIDNWINTFEYVIKNPDEEDNDPYQGRSIEPFDTWYEYVSTIRTIISDEIIESWKDLSVRRLGIEANKYGMLTGTKNAKTLKTLHERMLKMVKRRQDNIWGKTYEDDNNTTNYRLMNIFTLKEIAKERSIVTSGKNKNEIIELLQLHENNNNEQEISKLNTKELKNLAKDQGLPVYNNLKKDELVKLFTEPIKETGFSFSFKDFSLKLANGDDFVVSVRSDGYVHATALCKAGGKLFKHWHETDQTKALIKALESVDGITTTKTVQCIQGGNSKLQGSWVHPDLAVQMAQWISPHFAIQVSKWVRELFAKGNVSIERPTRQVANLSEIDVEAERLEMELDWSKYTNDICLYIAYIGSGLVKIGYSDSRIRQRENKHMSCESKFDQFRMVKIFKISSRTIEAKIHELLSMYTYRFDKQKEIYKVPATLEQFISMVGNLLLDHDLKLQLEMARMEIAKLKIENMELKACGGGRNLDI
jgi:hypothetical protein